MVSGVSWWSITRRGLVLCQVLLEYPGAAIHSGLVNSMLVFCKPCTRPLRPSAVGWSIAPAATSALKKSGDSTPSCASRPGAERSGLYQLNFFVSCVKRTPVVTLVRSPTCQITSAISASECAASVLCMPSSQLWPSRSKLGRPASAAMPFSSVNGGAASPAPSALRTLNSTGSRVVVFVSTRLSCDECSVEKLAPTSQSASFVLPLRRNSCSKVELFSKLPVDRYVAGLSVPSLSSTLTELKWRQPVVDVKLILLPRSCSMRRFRPLNRRDSTPPMASLRSCSWRGSM